MNSNKRYQNIELLAPAGSMETFQAVIHAGADAVYLGGGRFGARAYANNFTEEELLLAIDYAHIHGRKVYLTVNTLFKERELTEELYSYLLPYYEQGLDAVIIQDMGAFRLVREAFPGLSIHTSTQMTVTNRYGAMMMKELGADRVVTAREMSFAEIRDIKDHVDIETDLIEKTFTNKELCESIKKTNDPNLLDLIDPKVLREKTEEIIRIIEEIPKADEIVAMLEKVHGVKSLEDIGFTPDMKEKTARVAPYIRDRITFMRILKFYDFYDDVIK